MSVAFWKGKQVLVTGGSGFIGSHVVEQLVGHGARVRVPTRAAQPTPRFLRAVAGQIEVVACDLEQPDQARRAMRDQEIVLCLAANVAGIQYNIDHPGTIFRDNMRTFLNTLEAAREQGVERLLVTSSACVYPRHCTIPTPEGEGFVGRPEPTNEGYGWVKRMEEFLGVAYAHEFGMKIAIGRPYNGYGPRDNFSVDRSHVIPALIRRIWTERERPLQVWGSGKQSRSFLYVDDFARGLLEVAQKHAVAQAINLGSNEEVTIAELVEELNRIHEELEGRRFEVVFDLTKPEGQPRRKCDTALAESTIGFKAQWSLRDGLRKTVRWYLEEGKAP